MNIQKIKKILKKALHRGISEYDITSQDAKILLKEGNVILLDVRSPEEFKEGHLPYAILIPEYELKDSAKKLLPNLNQDIIVYCSSGSRSLKAIKTLDKLGYTHLYNLEGGIENWN